MEGEFVLKYVGDSVFEGAYVGEKTGDVDDEKFRRSMANAGGSKLW